MKVKADIKNIRKALTDAAKKPPSEVVVTSARGAVASLRPELAALLRRGYSPREVAQLLTEAGVQISKTSLLTYLRTPPKKADDRREEPPPNFEFQPLMGADENDQRI